MAGVRGAADHQFPPAEFVFPFHYASGQEERLERLRAVAADPAARRAYQLEEGRLGTPSLLGGEITQPGPLR